MKISISLCLVILLCAAQCKKEPIVTPIVLVPIDTIPAIRVVGHTGLTALACPVSMLGDRLRFDHPHSGSSALQLS